MFSFINRSSFGANPAVAYSSPSLSPAKRINTARKKRLATFLSLSNVSSHDGNSASFFYFSVTVSDSAMESLC
jgi:hypothetical protein